MRWKWDCVLLRLVGSACCCARAHAQLVLCGSDGVSGSGAVEDCKGVCGGGATKDACGVCWSATEFATKSNFHRDDCGLCFGGNEAMDSWLVVRFRLVPASSLRGVLITAVCAVVTTRAVTIATSAVEITSTRMIVATASPPIATRTRYEAPGVCTLAKCTLLTGPCALVRCVLWKRELVPRLRRFATRAAARARPLREMWWRWYILRAGECCTTQKRAHDRLSPTLAWRGCRHRAAMT